MKKLALGIIFSFVLAGPAVSFASEVMNESTVVKSDKGKDKDKDKKKKDKKCCSSKSGDKKCCSTNKEAKTETKPAETK